MRRPITIILIILLLISLVLGGLWYSSRKTAVKNGRPAPTFKEFIGFGSGAQKSDSTNNGLSSDFTEVQSGQEGATGGTPIKSVNGTPIKVSQFTTGSISPTKGTPIGDGSLGGGSEGGSGGPIKIITPPIKIDTTGGGEGLDIGENYCSEADMTITFTPEEIENLKLLQVRFERIAPFIHNDSDVATEFNNYTSYVLKEKKQNELYDYFVTRTPALPANLRTTTPTPFWNDRSQDTYGFVYHLRSTTIEPTQIRTGSLSDGVNYNTGDGIIFGTNPTDRPSLVENALRLNLW